ncbi:ankyrin repeat and KH domain-containing protein mask isoform X2 [Condylostylus longicornis]|uniref:ankyrin repeat and KH domain-containing protein mask isoform X2 n=1 Tax=Condylostylus longicornis TaxID=2530218 RepID=UPI00244E28EA|nr:ankyrin repeat and KH domain-containing protein mask isoform X2 [Condylostylus longicornis]
MNNESDKKPDTSVCSTAVPTIVTTQTQTTSKQQHQHHQKGNKNCSSVGIGGQNLNNIPNNINSGSNTDNIKNLKNNSSGNKNSNSVNKTNTNANTNSSSKLNNNNNNNNNNSNNSSKNLNISSGSSGGFNNSNNNINNNSNSIGGDSSNNNTSNVKNMSKSKTISSSSSSTTTTSNNNNNSNKSNSLNSSNITSNQTSTTENPSISSSATVSAVKAMTMPQQQQQQQHQNVNSADVQSNASTIPALSSLSATKSNGSTGGKNHKNQISSNNSNGGAGNNTINNNNNNSSNKQQIGKSVAGAASKSNISILTPPPAASTSLTTNISSPSSSSISLSSNASIQQQQQQQQLQLQQNAAAAVATSASASAVNNLISYALQNQNIESLVNYKLASDTSDTDTELQHRVTDLSESDEESVSEDEIPESDPESCGNDVDGNEDEDDGDDEDEDEDDEELQDPNETGNFLLDQTNDQRKLTALFEAANEKAPVCLKTAALAIDETKQALTKMRCSNSPRDKTIFSRTLIAACTDNDVNTVRRLLGKGNIDIDSTDDGESLLSMACSAGYYELAQVLLAMSAAQVEDKGQKDCTPLMEAASAGHLDIIRLLLSHNADVNAQCTTGNTPLMFACAGGHVEVVKVLLSHGAHVEDQNENGHTPLMEAASAGHVEVAKVLLEHGAGINTHSNEFKESALTLACYKGHLNMVKFLLEAGADQEHKTDEMHTALMEASMDGHVEVARLLLDSGAQVNMPTDSFESPLTLAACGGHVELATLLIERGANIEEVNDEGYTPLMEAAREGHEDMVALLLMKGANINATTEETQETALTLACCGGFTEVAEFLIKQGANLELGASTPLMEAAQEGHTELVRFLLENGANVHAQTQTGDTALTHACENGHTDAAEVLLYYGAELEHESEGGRTPLMKACRAGHVCTVKFLISKGADVNKETASNDHTPLSLACAGGHQAVVEHLLKSGADPFHKLKDNSTMLIEAAKGGHIRVVETLFKYPQFLQNHQNELQASNISSNAAAAAAAAAANAASQIQLSSMNLQQQKQLQHQLQQLAAPPGLHEVPEAVRVSNQQIFQHQQPPSQQTQMQQQQFQPGDLIDDQIIANTTAADNNGFVGLVDTSAAVVGGTSGNSRTSQQEEALIAKMRLFQLHAGFEDGLAHGLSRTQPDVLNQIINNVNASNTNNNASNATNLIQQTTNNNINTVTANQSNNLIASGTNNNNSTSVSTATSISTTSKQKSVLRKNRLPPLSFELNLTSSEAQQVRSQPLGEDDSSSLGVTNVAANLPNINPNNLIVGNDEQMPQQHQQQQRRKIMEEFQKKTNIQLVCEGNGPPPSLLPSAYVDITTASTQGIICNTGGMNFTPSNGTPIFGAVPNGATQQMQPASLATFAAAVSNAPTIFSGTGSVATTTSTQITTPSEVSQSTAISDRPKVKPVSKKDAKNLRKYAAAAQLQQQQQHQQQQQQLQQQHQQQLQQQQLQQQQQQIQNQAPLLMTTEPNSFQQQQQHTIGQTINVSGGAISKLQQQTQHQQPQTQHNPSVISIPKSMQTVIDNNGTQNQIQQTTLHQIPLSQLANTKNTSVLQNTCSNSNSIAISSATGSGSNLVSASVVPTNANTTPEGFKHYEEELKRLAFKKEYQWNKKMLQIFSQISDDQLNQLPKVVQGFMMGLRLQQQAQQTQQQSLEQEPQEQIQLQAEEKQHQDDLPKSPTLETIPYTDSSNSGVVSNITNTLNAAIVAFEASANAHNVEDHSTKVVSNSVMNEDEELTSIEPICPDDSLMIADEKQQLQDQQDNIQDAQQEQQVIEEIEDVDDEEEGDDAEDDDDEVDDEEEDEDEEDEDEDDVTEDFPTKSRKLSHHLENLIYSNVSLKTGDAADFVDISRALRDAVHDFRPELSSTGIVKVLQPNNNILQHNKATVNLNNVMQQQFTIGKYQDSFTAQPDEQFRLYPVEGADDEAIGDCIYPLSESLEGFTTDADDATRDQICSYELGLGECMEEFFNVFQNVNDPAFHELTSNLNCSEFAEFGINSFCKTRWAGQWVQQPQSQDIMTQGACITEEQQQQQQSEQRQILLDQQMLPNRLSIEEMQIYNQLQNQQATLSLVPLQSDEQQPPNIGIQTLPPSSVQQQTINQNNTNVTLQQANGLHIQQTQQMQQQQAQQLLSSLSNEAQQAKFLFNVDSDKPSPSLQLLFQLPPVQQGQQQQPAAIITAQQQQQQQQHQTVISTNQQQALLAQQQQSLQQQSQLNLNQQQCVQHAQQVQVATQTPQQQNIPGNMITTGTTQFCATVTPTMDGNALNIQHSHGLATGTTGVGKSSSSKKTLDKISRKDRNRYTVMRQTPAGSQANTTTQQYTTQQAGTIATVTQDKTIDVDSETDSNHDTALTLACAGGHEELVELLISRGANIEHRDKKGFTPLILAATAGHEKVVDILLKHGAELEAQSERTKDTPLSLACSGGRYEVVELLLSVGANKEHRNVSDYTPLSLAASGGYVNIIKLLLSSGAEINSRTGSKLGISPLMLAAMNGHTAAVKLLLDMGSDINAQIETNRNTALTLACFQGRHEVVSLLLDRKANVEHRAKTGLTPLMEAASGGYIEVGRVLLDKGADVNAAPVPTSRDTALTIAADKGHLKFVELLLSRRAAVEVKNKKGNSPLWLAAHGGHLAVVEVLYNHGADIDSQDNRRVSCLMAAFRKGHTKVVKWMVQHVTQFPSDQEMTRFISTISDKELLEKCYDCVKIIRAAKEAQAVKANKNASILLEELDMERTREESRRAAAARRRERKKKKKLEKKEEKRRLLEGNNPEMEDNANGEDKDDDKDSEKEEESDKEEGNVEDVRNREEGDSGIDQGSCSSSDVKAAAVQNDKPNKKKNNKKKNNKQQQKQEKESTSSKEKDSRASSSPIPSTAAQQDDLPLNQSSQGKTKNKKQPQDDTANRLSKKEQQKSNVTTNEPKKSVQVDQQKKDDSKKKEVSALPNNKDSSKQNREKEKENVTPKEESHQQVSSNTHHSAVPKPQSKALTDKKLNNENYQNFVQPQYHQQQQPQQYQQKSHGNETQRRSIIFSQRHVNEKLDEKSISDHTSIKSSPNKPLQISKRGEDGWKEVIRKSSTQTPGLAEIPLTSTATSSSSSSFGTNSSTVSTTSKPVNEITCKKVQVPVNAISRVIGRAGSNINAIRATTGAHIEVEKQNGGKTQVERCITIKGLAEATKQAHMLITTLIKDPDVDILQMLPKVNPNATKPPPPLMVPFTWEKNPSNNSGQPSASSAVFGGPSNMANNSANVSSNTQKPAKTTTLMSSSMSKSLTTTANMNKPCKTQMSSNNQIKGNTYMGNSSNSRSSTNQSNRASTHDYSSLSQNKRNSGENLSNTKTTMSFTNAVMSSKNSQSKTNNNIGQATFAAKLSSGGNQHSDKKSNTGQHISNQMSASFNSSPKKNYNSASTFEVGTFVVPTTMAQPRKSNVGSSHQSIASSSNYGMDNSNISGPNTQGNCGTGRSLTPIGHPINLNNRTVSSSPSFAAAAAAGTMSMQQHYQNHQGSNMRNIVGGDSMTSALSINTSMGASVSANSSLAIQPSSSAGIVSQLHSSSAKISHEYTLFNDSYQSQWESKQIMYNNSSNDTLPKIDASKAPGYNRGNVMSSPVSSKTSSNSTTPPGMVNNNVGTIGQQPNPNMLSNVSSMSPGSCAGSQLSSNSTNSSQNQQVQQQQQVQSNTNIDIVSNSNVIGSNANSTVGTNDISNILKPNTSQNINVPPPPPPIGSSVSGLAVQRPLNRQSQHPPVETNNNTTNNFGPIGPNTNRTANISASNNDPTQHSLNRTSSAYYDQMSSQVNYQQDNLQNQFHPNYNTSATTNPLHMSRLNPRASVFSNKASQQQQQSQQQSQQMYQGGNVGNTGTAGGYQQKMAPGPIGSQAPGASGGGGSNSGLYNPAPGRPQSQPQVGSNQRWYPSNEYSSYMSTSRDLLGLDNGIGGMGAGNSPASMSPNNQPNGIMTQQQAALNQASLAPPQHQQQNQTPCPPQPISDDNRKIPRPIGTERASWKHNIYSMDDMNTPQVPMNLMGTGANAALGGTCFGPNLNTNMGNLPPWMMDKTQHQTHQAMQQQPQQPQQPQQQLNWNKNQQHTRYYDINQQQQDHFHLPLDYSVPPPNVTPAINLMPPYQYAQLPGNYLPTVDYLPDKVESWEQNDKHGWSASWTN